MWSDLCVNLLGLITVLNAFHLLVFLYSLLHGMVVVSIISSISDVVLVLTLEMKMFGQILSKSM